ncbi:tetratricopeptide repeat-containing sensor histidine kinase [Flagellimonas meridianipacifica]|uniref:tetratricopeptide repeat-containing sensor histidine kinase n=1 Tax=Flagellimonas meridianipacifica TaxID=1080225 RepID=UPI001304CA91|nr:tetratricopeptide repeat protein [Allomuricauda pacifica]
MKNELIENTTRDTLRIKTLISTSAELTYTHPKSGLSYADEALVISQETNWKKGEALALRQKGNLYYVQADNLRALDHFQKALRLSVDLGDDELSSTLNSNIGHIHADLKEYDKALERYNAFLTFAEESNNIPNQIRGLSNIAIVYNDLENYEEGLPYLEKALKLAEQEDNDFFQAAIINNLALGYKGLKEYQKSLEYYHEAKGIAESIGNKYILTSALNSIGKVNILLGDYDAAEKAGKEALSLSQETGTIEWQADSWEVLSKVYEHQKNSVDALDAYKKHISYRDSVLNEEKKAELARKEMQFEMEKQQTAAAQEIEHQQLVKNGYLTGAILLAILGIAGYFFYKRRRDEIEKKKISDFKAKVAETELKALRSQMNPHFIFNSLNSISDLITKNDTENANEYLIKFSKLTRSILENSEKKWISVQEDQELMELYMQIESLRLKNKLSYTFQVDDDIVVEDTLIPPLILQPFIENSIWHGLAKKPEGGHINITMKKGDGLIHCVVEDNGVGRSKTLPIQDGKSSMGVKITRNRLEIINTLEETKGKIDLLDIEGGFRVEMMIPFELQF